ncbi:tumor necrosis factor receptor superfamily member 26-like isoform X2 [Passer domesticus]|uniref:tumor necrosis factor receptor superfamily member 26-like isoform X2 n=1 Tax=Passer domesticus TaxID=48849 RepID=UPI0030FEE460
MRAVMGAGRAVGLLLVVLLTMPRARANCGEGEYSHQGLCCPFCEAGTFVADHCNASHVKGRCDPCEEGKGFTAHENGLEECLPCKQCKEDQITLRPCNLTHDAECQCKQGYFCEDESCEMCQRISQEHPDGKEIMLNSTDATELGLTNQGNEARVRVLPVLLICFGFLVGVAIVVAVVKKLKCDKAVSTVKDVEGRLISDRMCSCDATGCDLYKVHKWLKYVKHPRFFVGLCLPSRPGKIFSTSSFCRS